MSSDKYPSLAALKDHLRKDDYRIRCLDRRSPVTIIAPHGGYIEPGTSTIARAVAGRQYNLFDFQGLREDLAKDMHVTATRFRDPLLTQLLKSSTLAVSIHGMGNQGHTAIWLGGRNKTLKELALLSMRARSFEVNPDSPLYRGESPRNVVNLSAGQGVQLELSIELMGELFNGTSFFYPRGPKPETTDRFNALIGSIREALKLYRATPLPAEAGDDSETAA